MLLDLPLVPIEFAMNRIIALDPKFKRGLTKHRGKVMAIAWPSLPITLYCQITAIGITLTTSYPDKVSTEIKGDPLSLTHLAFDLVTGSPTKHIKSVKIDGDMNFMQDLQRLFAEVDIDWEAQLAKGVGGPIAHQLATCMQSVQQYCQQSCDTAQQNFTEYVQEEARYTPPREEVNDFFNDVDECRMAADRLQARLDRLAVVAAQQAGSKSSSDK